MTDSVIYNILSTNAIVTGVVGANIFPDVAPQEEPSLYIVYHLIDVVPEITKEGASLLDEARVQVDCFAEDKYSANGLADKIRTALDQWTGESNRLTIDVIYFEDARADFDDERKIFQITQDFIIRHKKGI